MQEIIDFHAHIYPDKIALKATENVGHFYGIPMDNVGNVNTLLAVGRRAGVTNYVVHSVATTPEQVPSIHSFIASQCLEHGELTGFGAFHPDLTPSQAQQALDQIRELGLKGVKLHPDFQKFDIDDRKMYPFYEMIAGKLPILFHTGDDRYDFSSPTRLARVLSDFPNLTAVAAHFGGYRRWDEAQAVLPKGKVYIDTCSSIAFIGVKRAQELIRHYGADHVLFGTDFPMWDAKDELAYLEEMDLSQEERDLILSQNAKRLTGR